ncbi:50S ribosomal protein L29 [Streptomyces californicus]
MSAAKASELRELGDEELLNKLREAKKEECSTSASRRRRVSSRTTAGSSPSVRTSPGLTLMRERELGIETVESA